MSVVSTVRELAVVTADLLKASGQTPAPLHRRFKEEVSSSRSFFSWRARKPQWRYSEEITLLGWRVWKVTTHIEEMHEIKETYSVHYECNQGFEIWLTPEGELISVQFRRVNSADSGYDEYDVHTPATDEDIFRADLAWAPFMTTTETFSSPMKERSRSARGEPRSPGSGILEALRILRTSAGLPS